MYQQLIDDLNMLEIKRWIVSDQFGPSCEEVKILDFQIATLNAELLDAMVEPITESNVAVAYWPEKGVL